MNTSKIDEAANALLGNSIMAKCTLPHLLHSLSNFIEHLVCARLCARRRGGAVDQTWLSPGGAKNKAKRVPLMSNYDRGVKRPELKSCKVVIPNGFGTRDRLCGGQIFHRPEKG